MWFWWKGKFLCVGNGTYVSVVNNPLRHFFSFSAEVWKCFYQPPSRVGCEIITCWIVESELIKCWELLRYTDFAYWIMFPLCKYVHVSSLIPLPLPPVPLPTHTSGGKTSEVTLTPGGSQGATCMTLWKNKSSFRVVLAAEGKGFVRGGGETLGARMWFSIR